MKRLIIVAALLATLATSAAALAAGGPAITEKVLAAGGVAQPYAIDVAKPADVVVAKATVPAGASFGWHSHRAAVAVVVQSGTLTLYDSADPTARRSATARDRASSSSRTTSTSPATRPAPPSVLVTYLGLEHGVDPDVPAAGPGNCPF